jgi:hypothetical protein
MISPLGRAIALAAFLGLALTANAQPNSRSDASDPLDPMARSTPQVRPSALTRFRGVDDAPPVSWHDANATVHNVGGWRAYAREAQQAQKRPAVMKGEVVDAPASGSSGARRP